MKKNNFIFVIFFILIVPILIFTSCDNGTITPQVPENPNTPSVDSDGEDDKEDDKTQDEEKGWNSSSFLGDWQQNTHKTTITINDNGTFSLASSIPSFNGLTGTYENYIADDSSRCSRVSFNGLDGTYILTMIEDDVFEIALPDDMGGTCTFVKKRTENIDVKGRWESELLLFPIEFTKNAYTIYRSNGEAVENGSGSYTMDGNSFSADGNYGFTGLLAQSGKSYVYALW